MSTTTPRTALPNLPFRQYHAIPQLVTAVQLQAPEEVSNAHARGGFYRGEPGAWKIDYGKRPDGSADMAVCQPDTFTNYYEHLGGDRYQKKASVIVEAARLDAPLDISTLEGAAHGEPGDWLIIGMQGEMHFADDSYFRQHYTPAD